MKIISRYSVKVGSKSVLYKTTRVGDNAASAMMDGKVAAVKHQFVVTDVEMVNVLNLVLALVMKVIQDRLVKQ